MPAADAMRAWRMMSEIVLADDRKQRVTDELGLSFARIRVLRRLLAEPLTLRGLADALAADPPYVTLMIDDLEDRDLVARGPHPSDRRAKLVTLTSAGRKLATRAEEILDTPPPAIEALSGNDLKHLLDLLTKLHPQP